jgi:hypothetical protein
VIGGAKAYSFETEYGCTEKGNIQVKQKGITLDMANDEFLNWDTMWDMVLNTTARGPVDPRRTAEFDPSRKVQSKECFQCKWNSKTKHILNTHISQSIRSTIGEKRTIDGLDTLPFGWVSEAGFSTN